LNYALAVVSGLLLMLVFPGFNLAWLAPVALTPLLVALGRESRPGRRFLLGAVFGAVFWFGVVPWIQFVLAVHGGLGAAGGWAVFLLFCLAKSVHTGLFALAAGILLRSWWAVPAVSAAWVTLELAFTYSFAWVTLGNAGIDMSLPLRLAPFTGVYGLSFVFMMMATALALAILRRPRLQMAWLLALPLLVLLPPLPEERSGTSTAVLIQTNIPETERWTTTSLDQIEQELSALSLKTALVADARHPDLLIWPEVPAPFYYDEDPQFRERMNQLAYATRTNFLLGVVGHASNGAPLNSAVLISPEGKAVSRYDKIKLVPFGEFVPWPLGLVARHVSTEVGDFEAGTRVVVSPVGTHKLGAFICYESAFPDLVRKFAANGAEVLVNISNDDWFGRGAARAQHLGLVRMRAAETRRWILRSTNGGLTASVDPSGRVRMVLPRYVEAAASPEFNYLQSRTFYTEHGDWFATGCAILTAACLVVSRGGSLKRRHP
jgi:apolipoprotein N-acyltransferase